MAEDVSNQFKVSLSVARSTSSERVVFDVTPDIIENRNVNYKTMDPLHMPGSIHVYGSTSSRTYNISNVKFISRTQEEASKNIARLNLLRSWSMPYFGKSSTLSAENQFARSEANTRNTEVLRRHNENPLNRGAPANTGLRTSTDYGRELLGAPPEVLYINAYSESGTAKRGKQMNIHRVPVILQQLSIPYPSDVDYISSKEGIPFPTIMTVDVTLMETHAPREYTNFSLQDFKDGKLENF